MRAERRRQASLWVVPRLRHHPEVCKWPFRALRSEPDGTQQSRPVGGCRCRASEAEQVDEEGGIRGAGAVEPGCVACYRGKYVAGLNVDPAGRVQGEIVRLNKDTDLERYRAGRWRDRLMMLEEFFFNKHMPWDRRMVVVARQHEWDVEDPPSVLEYLQAVDERMALPDERT
jgi:hypothetical protein